MQRSNRELWAAFIAVIVTSLGYLYVVARQGSIPAASEFFGHTLGIAGFLMMLMTETLYTLRKRSRSARWGKMANWLQFHIFTGIVGPYLVLLHSSWKFNGVAGILMLLTGIVVASGFIGRYIYTAVPRTVDGFEIEAAELTRLVQQAEHELQNWLATQSGETRIIGERLVAEAVSGSSVNGFVFGRFFAELSDRINWWQVSSKVSGAGRAQIRQLEMLSARKRTLQRQIASLATARQFMALWHTIHIPIGIALFGIAFIHILGAIYYATLLH